MIRRFHWQYLSSFSHYPVDSGTIETCFATPKNGHKLLILTKEKSCAGRRLLCKMQPTRIHTAIFLKRKKIKSLKPEKEWRRKKGISVSADRFPIPTFQHTNFFFSFKNEMVIHLRERRRGRTTTSQSTHRPSPWVKFSPNTPKIALFIRFFVHESSTDIIKNTPYKIFCAALFLLCSLNRKSFSKMALSEERTGEKYAFFSDGTLLTAFL